MIPKVKIIYGPDLMVLEQEINRWLSNTPAIQPEKFHLVAAPHIHHGPAHGLVVVIVYTQLSPLDR